MDSKDMKQGFWLNFKTYKFLNNRYNHRSIDLFTCILTRWQDLFLETNSNTLKSSEFIPNLRILSPPDLAKSNPLELPASDLPSNFSKPPAAVSMTSQTPWASHSNSPPSKEKSETSLLISRPNSASDLIPNQGFEFVHGVLMQVVVLMTISEKLKPKGFVQFVLKGYFGLCHIVIGADQRWDMHKSDFPSSMKGAVFIDLGVRYKLMAEEILQRQIQLVKHNLMESWWKELFLKKQKGNDSVGEKDYFCNKKNETTCAIFAKKQAWTEIEVFTTPWGQSAIGADGFQNTHQLKRHESAKFSIDQSDHFCKVFPDIGLYRVLIFLHIEHYGSFWIKAVRWLQFFWEDQNYFNQKNKDQKSNMIRGNIPVKRLPKAPRTTHLPNNNENTTPDQKEQQQQNGEAPLPNIRAKSSKMQKTPKKQTAMGREHRINRINNSRRGEHPKTQQNRETPLPNIRAKSSKTHKTPKKPTTKAIIDTHLGLRSDLDREGAAPVWWTEMEETNGGSCARGGDGVISRDVPCRIMLGFKLGEELAGSREEGEMEKKQKELGFLISSSSRSSEEET
ncbi:hypothetical protein LXL04_024340 [Taraxacum kok-saghyz]